MNPAMPRMTIAKNSSFSSGATAGYLLFLPGPEVWGGGASDAQAGTLSPVPFSSPLTHLISRSMACFMSDTLSRLEATIARRSSADPASSYVAKLNARGLPKIAQKLGEEAVETVIAAICGDEAELVGEAADLLFHLIVLLQAKGVPLGEVLAELDRREGVSGIAEKAARKAD